MSKTKSEILTQLLDLYNGVSCCSELSPNIRKLSTDKIHNLRKLCESDTFVRTIPNPKLDTFVDEIEILKELPKSKSVKTSKAKTVKADKELTLFGDETLFEDKVKEALEKSELRIPHVLNKFYLRSGSDLIDGIIVANMGLWYSKCRNKDGRSIVITEADKLLLIKIGIACAKTQFNTERMTGNYSNDTFKNNIKYAPMDYEEIIRITNEALALMPFPPKHNTSLVPLTDPQN